MTRNQNRLKTLLVIYKKKKKKKKCQPEYNFYALHIIKNNTLDICLHIPASKIFDTHTLFKQS